MEKGTPRKVEFLMTETVFCVSCGECKFEYRNGFAPDNYCNDCWFGEGYTS